MSNKEYRPNTDFVKELVDTEPIIVSEEDKKKLDEIIANKTRKYYSITKQNKLPDNRLKLIKHDFLRKKTKMCTLQRYSSESINF